MLKTQADTPTRSYTYNSSCSFDMCGLSKNPA